MSTENKLESIPSPSEGEGQGEGSPLAPIDTVEILVDALIKICRLTHDGTARTDFEVRYQAFDLAAMALDRVGGPQFCLSPAITALGRHPEFRKVLAQ